MLLRRIPRGVRVPVPVCAVSVAALWAVIGGRAGLGVPLWWWPVPALLAWGGVLLGSADLVARRLPDALTLPAYPLAAGVLGIAALGAGHVGPLTRAAVGALLWAGGYAAIRLISPGALWRRQARRQPGRADRCDIVVGSAGGCIRGRRLDRYGGGACAHARPPRCAAWPSDARRGLGGGATPSRVISGCNSPICPWFNNMR